MDYNKGDCVSIDPDYVKPVGTLTETKVWLASIGQGGDQRQGYDVNGFFQSETTASTSARATSEGKDAWRMARRVGKWRKMLGPGGEGLEGYLNLKPQQRWEKLKRRARKGIPEQVSMHGPIP